MEIIAKKSSWTFEEFLQKKDSKDYSLIDKALDNEKFNKFATVTLASALFLEKHTQPVLAADKTAKALAKIDSVGLTFLHLFQKLGYWTCLIMAIIQIIKTVLSGDKNALGEIIIKFLIAFSSFYFMPYIFDLVKDIFG